MPRPELTARNDRMVHYYVVHGFSAAQIGAFYGISDARVFQILKRRGVRRAETQADISPTRAAGAAPTGE